MQCRTNSTMPNRQIGQAIAVAMKKLARKPSGHIELRQVHPGLLELLDLEPGATVGFPASRKASNMDGTVLLATKHGSSSECANWIGQATGQPIAGVRKEDVDLRRPTAPQWPDRRRLHWLSKRGPWISFGNSNAVCSRHHTRRGEDMHCDASAFQISHGGPMLIVPRPVGHDAPRLDWRP